MLKKSLLLAGCLAAALCGSVPSASALEDATRAPYQNAFKGKKVAFFPITMSIDITQTWAAEMEEGSRASWCPVRHSRRKFQRRLDRAGHDQPD